MNEFWKNLEGQAAGDKYRLGALLGGTDRSAVYAANGSSESPKRAIKLFKGQNSEALARQWKTVAGLSHPHIQRIYDIGRCRIGAIDFDYVVMEYGEESLAQLMPERALTPAEAKDMLPPVLSALEYLHTQGFTHGHLKPANVLAVGDQVKISSDGISKTGDAVAIADLADTHVAPETRTSAVSSRESDVWALGVTLAEVLTQRAPILTNGTRADAALPKAMPEPFREISAACLDRDPNRRWTTAQIASRLNNGSGVEPAATRPSAVPTPTAPGRRYLVPALGIGLFLIAVFAGPKLMHRSSNQPDAVNTANAQPQPPVSSTSDTPANRPITQNGGNFVPGTVVDKPVPDISAGARRTVHGVIKVGVLVKVDASGNIARTELRVPGPSKFFARKAEEAAKQWKFTPAQVNGQAVPSEWNLQFHFRRSGTDVSSALATHG